MPTNKGKKNHLVFLTVMTNKKQTTIAAIH